MSTRGQMLLYVEGHAEPISVADGVTWTAALHDMRLAVERGFFIVDVGDGIEVWLTSRAVRVCWRPVDDAE